MKKILIFALLFLLIGCNDTPIQENDKYYEVVFMVDENVIKKESVLEGASATAPSDPFIAGYKFDGWDKDFSNVLNNLEIKATFSKLEEKKYTITFVDGDIVILSTEVTAGHNYFAPNAPIKEGYTFIGWDKDVINVQSDMVINAIYEKIINKFEVIFMDGINIISKVIVEEGKDATAPSSPTKEGYEFIGWDKDFTNVRSDLTINSIYKLLPVYYSVIFKDGYEILKNEKVQANDNATAPTPPSKEGYEFIGWDIAFTNVTSDLVVNAIYNENTIELKDYVSYIDVFSYQGINTPRDLIDSINETNLKNKMTNIINGGARGTNEVHFYNASNIINRNIYGFEIAVDESGIVVGKATILDLPKDGFLISAHGTGIDKINSINIGDILKYDSSLQELKVYFDNSKNSVIGLFVTINELISKVEEANYLYKALDYVKIEQNINKAINLYNDLLINYSLNKVNEASGLLLNTEFLLVEVTPVQTKAYWHYPLYPNQFKETNLEEIETLLDNVNEMGFNKIYLNTNSNGRAVYKSKYLVQQRTTNYTYGNYKDYLECFITEAHKRNITVSAWTNTLIAGDGVKNSSYSDSVYLKGINGEDNHGRMYFVDISNPEIQVLLDNVFNELASYDLDGIEFDFIRYPSGNLRTKTGDLSGQSGLLDWGYTNTFINAFKEENPFEGDFKSLVLKNQDFRKKWLDFKENYLSKTVERLVNVIKTKNPDISISAAIMSNINTAKNTYLQNWEYWVNQGWIDTLDPMIYSGDANYVINQLKNMYNLIKDKAYIVAGIFPETDGGLVGMTATQIDAITNLYPAGWAKFSSKNIFNSQIKMDAYSQMKRVYTVLPSVSSNKILKAYIYDLLDHLENYYSYKDTTTNYLVLIELLKNAYLSTNPIDFISQIENNLNLINNEVIKAKLLVRLNTIKNYIKD